jgi:hypothetical protein
MSKVLARSLSGQTKRGIAKKSFTQDASNEPNDSIPSVSPSPESPTSSTAINPAITAESIRTMSPEKLSVEAIQFIMKDLPANLMGSTMRTETHNFSGWSSLWFESYQHAAACKSAFNKQFINVKLGITGDTKNGLKRNEKQAVRVPKDPKIRRPENAAALELRTSRRIAKLAVPEPLTLPEDDAAARSKSSQKPRKVYTVSTSSAKLLPSELELLDKFCSESSDWLGDFDTYLEHVERISDANKRNVLRQVKRLVKGDGIGYKHWGEGVVFKAPAGLRLGVDMVQLYDQAEEFEIEHGRDLGNGTFHKKCRMLHPL